jgi:uncharacterized protein (AIM24 family)
MTGSKDFMTEFVYSGQQEGYGGKLVCQRGTYLCSADTVSIVVDFAGSLGAAFFGGEGFGFHTSRNHW